MKAFILVLVIVAVGIGVFFIFKDDYEITNYPTSVNGPVIAFGDSLIVGVGAEKGEDFVSRLERKINEPIINLGLSGDTSEGGLARVEEVLEKEPRIVIISLGGNDYLRRISKEETFRNLKILVNKIQSQGAITVVLGVRGGVLRDHYDREYEALARETGSVLVEDILDGLLGNLNYMDDAIHPNSLGNKIIAEKIYPKLLEVLE